MKCKICGIRIAKMRCRRCGREICTKCHVSHGLCISCRRELARI